MAKLKSFEEYIADMDSAEEIEKDIMDMGEPEEAGDGEEVQSPEQDMGGEEAEDAVDGEEAGEEVEDMDGPESEGEQDMKVGDEVVDTDPEDKSDEIEDEMEDPEPNEVEKEEVEEGNAFGDAVRKAKEAGEDEFEFDGKTYKVTESEEEEVEEGDMESDKEEVAKAMVADMMKEMFEACKGEAKAYEEDMHDEHTIESYMKENAALAAALATQALKEMREDMTLEMYEAACEGLKESYSKKIDEMKEAWSAEGEEVHVEDDAEVKG